MSDMKPRFGDIIENGWASEDNPTRRGFFVREGRRTGRMNAGRYFEATDGAGKFWELPIDRDHKVTIVARAHPHPDVSPDHIPDAGKMVVSSDVSQLVEALEPFARLYNQIIADAGPEWFADEGQVMRAALAYPVANNAVVWRHFRLAAEALAALSTPQEAADLDSIAEAFRKGAMYALGRKAWDDADDFFSLCGNDYAKGNALPSKPVASIPANERSDGERAGMEAAMGKKFCDACMAFPTHGYCNLAGCPMPRPSHTPSKDSAP